MGGRRRNRCGAKSRDGVGERVGVQWERLLGWSGRDSRDGVEEIVEMEWKRRDSRDGVEETVERRTGESLAVGEESKRRVSIG